MEDKNFENLLDILACPKCKGELEYKKEEAFICYRCKLLFPIKDGIPILLIEKAIKLEEDEG